MPSFDLLKIYKDMGGELLTVGSDSPNIENVGAGIDYTYTKLKELGFKYISAVKNKKIEQIKIEL
jgi:histidinol-phosphatase (PHP family)